MTQFKEPTIKNIETISPSIINSFNVCPKKAAYFLDSNFSELLKGSTTSSLGKIAHFVLADSNNLETQPNSIERQDWFNENWRKYEDQEFLSLQNDWNYAEVPKPMSWNKYHAVKSSVKYKVLEKHSRFRGTGNVEKSDQVRVKFPISEKYLVNKNLGLKGKPDLIDKYNGVISIIDYKTGSLTEDTLEDYSRQLHLYVILVEEELKLEIEKLYIFGNTVEEIELVRSRLPILQKEIIRIIDNLNQNKFQAKPSLENCKFCSFKVYCEDFWKISFSFKADRPLILKGKVSQIHKTADSQYFSIDLNLVESVPKYDFKSIRLHKISSKFQIELDSEYSFMGNLDYLLEDQFRVNWNTIVFKI
jgi:CRISPR/Cas system-associated exonuclease Cas4 (RecB family)